MNGISGGPLQSFQVSSPATPLGKPAVGLEPLASKDLPVAPVEAAPAAEAVRQRQQAISNAQELYQPPAAVQAAAAAQGQEIAARYPSTTSTNAGIRTAESRTTGGSGSTTPASGNAARRRLAAAFGDAPALGSIIDQRA